MKQHSDTNHSANVGQGSAGTFRSSAEVARPVTASAVYSLSGIANPTTILDKRKAPDMFVDSRRFDSVYLRRSLFPNPYKLSPNPYKLSKPLQDNGKSARRVSTLRVSMEEVLAMFDVVKIRDLVCIPRARKVGFLELVPL